MLPASKLKGTDGRITYPALGALIAETFAWQLYSEDGKSYTLKAHCKYVVDALWDEVGDKRQIELMLQRGVWFIARPIEGAVVERTARQIVVKGVLLERKES